MASSCQDVKLTLLACISKSPWQVLTTTLLLCPPACSFLHPSFLLIPLSKKRITPKRTPKQTLCGVGAVGRGWENASSSCCQLCYHAPMRHRIHFLQSFGICHCFPMHTCRRFALQRRKRRERARVHQGRRYPPGVCPAEKDLFRMQTRPSGDDPPPGTISCEERIAHCITGACGWRNLMCSGGKKSKPMCTSAPWHSVRCWGRAPVRSSRLSHIVSATLECPCCRT